MLINKAISIAAEKCSEKREAYSGEAYLFRIMQTLLIVKELTDDENVHAATALYGVLDEIDAGEIIEEFGQEIANLIEPLREDLSKTWKARKKATLNFLRKKADLRQKAIVLANELIEIRLLYNSYTNLFDDVFERFDESKYSYSAYYLGLIDVLEDLDGYNEYCQFRTKVNDIFKKSTFWDMLRQFVGMSDSDNSEEWG